MFDLRQRNKTIQNFVALLALLNTIIALSRKENDGFFIVNPAEQRLSIAEATVNLVIQQSLRISVT